MSKEGKKDGDEDVVDARALAVFDAVREDIEKDEARDRVVMDMSVVGCVVGARERLAAVLARSKKLTGFAAEVLPDDLGIRGGLVVLRSEDKKPEKTDGGGVEGENSHAGFPEASPVVAGGFFDISLEEEGADTRALNRSFSLLTDLVEQRRALLSEWGVEGRVLLVSGGLVIEGDGRTLARRFNESRGEDEFLFDGSELPSDVRTEGVEGAWLSETEFAEARARALGENDPSVYRPVDTDSAEERLFRLAVAGARLQSNFESKCRELKAAALLRGVGVDFAEAVIREYREGFTILGEVVPGLSEDELIRATAQKFQGDYLRAAREGAPRVVFDRLRARAFREGVDGEFINSVVAGNRKKG